MCGPIPAIIGIATAGLGIAQQVAQYQQAKTNAAFANAQAQQQYQQQLMQAQASRSFEQMRANQQDALIAQTRLLADQSYADEIGQLNLRTMQEQEAAAQKKQEAGRAAMQARGEVLSAGRMGNSIDNLIADVHRQQAMFDYATDRNLAFATQMVQEQKRGSGVTRAGRIASQQPYIQQQIVDPLSPIETPMPSATPYVIGGMSSAMSGVSAGFAMASQMEAAGFKTNYWGFKKR